MPTRLSVAWSLQAGDEYRARYFLQKLMDAAPGSARGLFGRHAVWRRTTTMHGSGLPRWSTTTRPVDAFSHGGTQRNASRPGPGARFTPRSSPLYQLDDPGRRARLFPTHLGRTRCPAARHPSTGQLRVRLLWSVLSADFLGLKDSNISCLRVDGDDLWVGTWNGGVARYSVSSGQQRPVPRAAILTVHRDRGPAGLDRHRGRALLVRQGHGAVGLGERFRAAHPYNVQVVRATRRRLFAGTLGDGLFTSAAMRAGTR